jgi:hypothetical protein
MSLANYFGQLAKIRPAKIVAHEVDDEIDFHIECRVNELVRQGVSENTARTQTLARFGDRKKIAWQCRKIQMSPARTLAWIGMSLASLALAVIVWLCWSLASLKMENASLVERMNAAMVPVPPSQPARASAVPALQDDSKTLAGNVFDTDGKPVAGAKVLLIHKSWRDGYDQADHVTETGEDGAWKFEELYQTGIQNAFLVTVVADGFEMKSDYGLHKPGKGPRKIDFKLKPAPRKVFTFQDADGNPLPENDVVVLVRKAGTKEYMLYEQNALEAKKVTDEEGKAEFSCLLKGDLATFGIVVFGEFQSVDMKITDEESPVVRLQKKTP